MAAYLHAVASATAHRFNYISASTKDAVVQATGIMADKTGAPKQGHISITSNADEMTVSYTSGTEKVPSVRCTACQLCAGADVLQLWSERTVIDECCDWLDGDVRRVGHVRGAGQHGGPGKLS